MKENFIRRIKRQTPATAHQLAISHSLKFYSLDKDGSLYGLLLEVQELFPFLILHKVFKIQWAVKFYQVDFVRMLDVGFDKCFFAWPDPEQQPAIVFADDRDGHILKLVEDTFLAFADIDELGDVEHMNVKSRFIDRSWLICLLSL